jgi:hypothetical protein
MEAVEEDKEEEILGGLKNAMGRGETLQMARLSFLNAGYKPHIVDLAASRISGQGVSVVEQQPVPQAANIPAPQAPNVAPQAPNVAPQAINVPAANLNLYAQRPPAQQGQMVRKRAIPYWAIIMMLIMSLGILVGAGVLGLFWDKLFN